MLWFEANDRAVSRGVRLAVVESPDRVAPLVGALDAAGVGAWVWVEAEDTLYWSPRVAEILGIAPDDRPAAPEALLARVHPDDRQPGPAMFDETFLIRYRFLHQDGSYHWIQDRGRTQRDAHGRLIQQSGAICDITDEVLHEAVRTEITGTLEALLADQYAQRSLERMVTELALELVASSGDELDDAIRSALQRLVTYFGAGGAAIYETTEGRSVIRVSHYWTDPAAGLADPDGREPRADPFNARIGALTGDGTLVIRRPDELPRDSPEAHWMQAHGFRAVLMVPLARGNAAIGALGLAHRLGEPRDWTDTDAAHLRFAAAVLANALSRRAADEQRHAVERRLLDAQKLQSLGALAGGIAHDFNNLLTAVLGHASLARSIVAPSRADTSLEQIEIAAKRAAELCRQMLAYAGRARVERSIIDLNSLVEDTSSLLHVSVSKKTSLDVRRAAHLPAVEGDHSQLRQILMSLVINASEAIGDREGVITISTGDVTVSGEQLANTVFSPDLPGGRYVSLEVRDTGPGMSADTQARIFDPFFTTKFTGRGLGLASVVGIVRAHRGALRVTSAPGAGSAFLLLLPAHEGRPAVTLADTELTSHASPARNSVLVIDDEPGVRTLVQAVLEPSGVQVTLAEDGRRGLELFLANPDRFDAVLVDLTMPGLDGHETLAAMREQRPGLRAILMSGYTEQDAATTAAHTFLQKPFSPQALRTALTRLFDA